MSDKYREAAKDFFTPINLYRFETEEEVEKHFKKAVRVPSAHLGEEKRKRLRDLLNLISKTHVFNITSGKSETTGKYWTFDLGDAKIKLAKRYEDFAMMEYLSMLCGYPILDAEVTQTTPFVTIAAKSFGSYRPTVDVQITLTSLVTTNVHATVRKPALAV